MKKFEFKFSSYLQIQRNLLEEQELRLGLTVSEYNRVKKVISENREKHEQIWENKQSHNAKIFSTDYLYIERLKQQYNNTTPQLEEKKQNMTQEQKKYNAIIQKVKGLEHIEEREFKEYQRKTLLEEERENLEIFLARNREGNV